MRLLEFIVLTLLAWLVLRSCERESPRLKLRMGSGPLLMPISSRLVPIFLKLVNFPITTTNLIKCTLLSIELPGPVWDDVNAKWNAVVAQINL